MGRRYGLEIRAATASDAAGMADLFRAAGMPVAAADLAERLDALRSASGTALVAMEWGPPSGVVLLHWFRTLDASQPVAQISALLVGPDERRRGIGRLLVKAAAQAARSAGCGTLQLAVSPDQDGMRAFCESTGFAEAGILFARPLRKKGDGTGPKGGPAG